MMSIRIYFVATLLFVVIGLVGNALSMLVFSSREMQGVSSNVYLLTLAVTSPASLTYIYLYTCPNHLITVPVTCIILSLPADAGRIRLVLPGQRVSVQDADDAALLVLH